MSYILPNVLRALKEKYPLLKFNVLDRSREGILSLLGKGEADVGVSSFPSNLTKDFYYEAISRHSRVLLLPKKHPLSGKKKLSLSNLKDIPLILSPEGSRTRQAVTDAFLRFQIEPNISIEVSDREAMKKYTALGFGVSVLSDYYIVSEDKKHFHVRDMSSVFGWSDRGVITLKNRYLSAPAKEFIDLLKKEFKKNKTRVSSV